MNLARSALLALVLLAIAGGLAHWHRAVPPRAPGELRIVHGPLRLSLDPRVSRDPASLPQRLIGALWEPLLASDADGNVVPAAAVSWDVAPDLRRVTLRLRDDLRWNNGEPVTAGDFIRTVEWFEQSGRNGGLLAVLQSRAEGAARSARETLRASDERTLVIDLPRPTPGILLQLAAARWIPLHATNPAVLASERYRAEPSALVTNGAFALVEAGPQTWRLVRDPRSRFARDVALEAVRLVRSDGPTLYPTIIAADRADLSDAAPYIPERLRPIAEPSRLHVENTTGISLLHFNTHKPPLDDARVRRALSLALDRRALAAALGSDGGVPAFSCMPTADGAPPEHTVEENLAEARRLLAEAGYPGGRGMPVLRLPLVRAAFSNPMAYYCADQWRARLGIRVYVIPLPLPQINARLARGDFDLMHFYWSLDESDQSLFASAPLNNLPPAYRLNLSREQAGALAAARSRSGDARRDAMREIERTLLAAMPCTPVVAYRRCYVIGPDVRGWDNDLSGGHPFAGLCVASASSP